MTNSFSHKTRVLSFRRLLLRSAGEVALPCISLLVVLTKCGRHILLTMVFYHELILRFDGACRGKNRDSGSGWLLVDKSTNSVIAKGRYYIGTHGTNNVAEYMGLLGGLKFIQNKGIQIGNTLYVQGDSELVIKHMASVYAVKSRRLRPLWKHCDRIIEDFDFYVDFSHIYREHNQQADALANEAIDYEDSSADWN